MPSGHPQPNGPTAPPHPPHPPHPQAQVITVDQRPLVLHLLIGLCRAGLERAVVAVGEGAELIETAVREAELPMQVSYVTVPPSLWRNLANSILMCKAAFKTDEPLLIVRADQLYDWRLLRKIVCAPFVPGMDAFALVDPAPETLDWASGALCGPSCKHAGNTGRCNSLVKVARGADGRAVRCGCMLDVPLRRRHSSHACAPRTGSPRRGLPRTLGTRRRAARGALGSAAAVGLGRGRRWCRARPASRSAACALPRPGAATGWAASTRWWRAMCTPRAPRSSRSWRDWRKRACTAPRPRAMRELSLTLP